MSAFRAGTRARRLTASCAALVAGMALLAGCSGDDPSAEETTTSAPTVDEADLGLALDALIFQAEEVVSTDSGACFVAAVQDAGLSTEAQAYIIEHTGEDLGAVSQGLLNISEADAELLLSPQLHEAFDDCADDVVAGDEVVFGDNTSAEHESGEDEASDQTAAPSEEETEAAEDEVSSEGDDASSESVEESADSEESVAVGEQSGADLEPVYDIDPDLRITSVDQLEPGLLSMFSSFAQTEEQKMVYENTSGCMAELVLDSDFSQETLRFLAGGAEIGTGSVVDYLPTEEDKAIWESQEFTTGLVNCTTTGNATDGSE